VENATKTAVIEEKLRNQFDMKQDKTSDLRHSVPNEQQDNKLVRPTSHLPKLIPLVEKHKKITHKRFSHKILNITRK